MAPRTWIKCALSGGMAVFLAVVVPAVQAGKASVADFVHVVGEPETDAMWSPAPAPEHGLDKGANRKRTDSQVAQRPALRDGPNCPDGEGCFWRQTNFNGNKISVEGNSSTCCDWRYVSGFEDWWQSAKNRYGNRKLQLGDQYNVIACIGPGGERDDPGIYDRARIGSAGSDC